MLVGAGECECWMKRKKTGSYVIVGVAGERAKMHIRVYESIYAVDRSTRGTYSTANAPNAEC